MKIAADLRAALLELVPDPHAPLVGIGSLQELQPLTQLFPRLIIVDGQSSRKRLVRGPTPANLVRAGADQLPFARSSIAGLLALDVLPQASDPAALVAAWAASIRPRGWLLIIERLLLSASLAALRRLLGKAPYLRPEDQTGLLLNAGFSDIRQRWPRSPGRRVITCAQLRPFARQSGGGDL